MPITIPPIKIQEEILEFLRCIDEGFDRLSGQMEMTKVMLCAFVNKLL